tara:strand:- start:1559 stop:2371 length:813 start_codon:yes stop_codon:yes gene_type:complete
MGKGYLRKGVLDMFLGIFKRAFPSQYASRLETEAQSTSVYKGLQSNLKSLKGENKILNVKVMCNRQTNEGNRQEERKIRKNYEGRLAEKQSQLEQMRGQLLANVVQGIANYKQRRGLEEVVYQQRARTNRDKNDIPAVMGSIFSKPPFRKIPVLMVHNQGHIYYQNAASRKQVGDLKGMNIDRYLDCANPNKQEITIHKQLFTCWVFPAFGGRKYDYSIVYFKHASAFRKIKSKFVKEEHMDKALDIIKAQMKAVNEKLDKRTEEGLDPA